MDNKELFKSMYKAKLHEAHFAAPHMYVWPISEFDDVVERMNKAIDKGSFNKDSLAFKMTCKALKIKHTYRDIECFLGGYKL